MILPVLRFYDIKKTKVTSPQKRTEHCLNSTGLEAKKKKKKKKKTQKKKNTGEAFNCP